MSKPLFTIYVLECQHDCWYIGASGRPDIRIPGHFRDINDGWTPVWLQKHPAIRLVERYIISGGSDMNDEEDRKTEELMKRYGIDKVAGGKYVHPRVRAKFIRGGCIIPTPTVTSISSHPTQPSSSP
jgi:predicted GIY-YIG superfamily endonuclease